MRKILSTTALALLLTGTFISCKKEAATEDANAITADEKSMVKAAGFNSNWVERTADGNYLVEGDILLSAAELKEMGGQTLTNNFIVANEEHYRTYNLVSTPSTGYRTITVRLSSGFPAHYSTALDASLARYNGYNLKIRFQRVSSGGDIVISASNLGTTSGGGCILGQAAGFPSGGNPSKGFTLSNSSCATTYLNTSTKADEVIAHELGHCIGFRHTDYVNRSSCGPGGGESAGSVGAVHIPGTPTTVSGNYNSWMMACTNGSASFSSSDVTALNYVY
ncbi:MAG TPA: M57 family metalloprotease [Segetibacter sp.]|jgi:hypothetical protein